MRGHPNKRHCVQMLLVRHECHGANKKKVGELWCDPQDPPPVGNELKLNHYRVAEPAVVDEDPVDVCISRHIEVEEPR